jgi:hypothetical protein
MTHQEFIDQAKSKGVILSQIQLYIFAEVGLTDEEERLLYEEDIVPEDLDPKIVHDLAMKWNQEHQYDKIPASEYMACC